MGMSSGSDLNTKYHSAERIEELLRMCGFVWDNEDLEEVIETLDNYREEMGAEGTEGVLELSDFLLVTFDYYLAMGAARMRALYIDLLLT